MKKDIAGPEDIAHFTAEFYGRALRDPLLSEVFNDVAKISLEHHLPIINSFWENILFDGKEYNGNTLRVHQVLHEQIQLTKAHFDCWLSIFDQVIDENFDGPIAFKTKQRALSIAMVMQIKLSNIKSEKA